MQRVSGKVDRRALPIPHPQSITMASPDRGYPGEPLEEIVGNVWLQVLKLDSVHPDDNFFALGGHSLLATQVISRLNTLFGMELRAGAPGGPGGIALCVGGAGV